MANKIREKVESELDQSEPTENEPEEFDERVPEPEVIVSEKSDGLILLISTIIPTFKLN